MIEKPREKLMTFYHISLKLKGDFLRSLDLQLFNHTDSILFSDRYVLSSRVRTGRAIRGIPHPPVCSRAERREVERVVTDALQGLPSDLAGKYYSLKSMTDAEQDQLIDVRLTKILSKMSPYLTGFYR